MNLSDTSFISLLKEMLLFRNTLDYESDRGCALTAGAYIDQKLKTLLLANFFDSPKARDFVDVNQPLGTFSARIDPARIPAPDREGHFCAEPPMCLS